MIEDTSLPAVDEQPDKGSGVYVSLESLSVDGVPPTVGDTVGLQVEGTVSSLESGVACVQPVTINGQPAPQAPNEKPLRDTVSDQMSALDEGDY